jgi:transglutaminase-like putative cysteine protease
MRVRHTVLSGVLAALWIVGSAHRAAAQEWPPITDEEKALVDCPQQAGAPAIFLYREERTSQEKFTTAYYCRLKILTPAGRDRANLEIPVYHGWTKITGLNARVVRPDGVSVPFTGQVFEKTVLRAGRIKVTVKTIALPDVGVGSIIDYRYTVAPDNDKSSSSRGAEALEDLFGNYGKPPEGGIATDEGVIFLPVEAWDVQADLFTLRAKFSYEPWSLLGTALAEWSRRRVMLTWATRWIGTAQPGGDSSRVELELKNVPAFEPEDLMPPESSQRMEVRLFYIATSAMTPDEYWREESGNWQRGAEKFMSNAGAAAEVAKMTVAGLDDPEAKIRALYERAQKIKNLSYDRTLTGRKRKELNIKTNRSVADVLRNRYGLRSDITRTFAALAIAAGFPARVVRVATRDDKLFELNLCDLYGQFDTELAVLQVDGQDRFYDPATPFCPPGLVRWNCTSTTMLDPTQAPPSVLKAPVKTQAGTPEQALTRRETVLSQDAEGNLAGTVKVRFGGQEALDRRLLHLDDDEAEVKKDLEAEMADVLPAGAKVTLQKVENLRNSADEVLAEFEVFLPGLVTSAGGRTLLPVTPLLGPKQHPFQHAQRKYPVSFPYPYRVSDDIVISLQAGLKVDAVPAPRNESRDGFDYSLACAVENGTTLHVQREFKLAKCDFLVSFYDAVRGFFDRVRTSDEEPVLLSAAEK